MTRDQATEDRERDNTMQKDKRSVKTAVASTNALSRVEKRIRNTLAKRTSKWA